MCIVIKKFDEVVVNNVDNVKDFYVEVLKKLDSVVSKGLIYKNNVVCNKFCLVVKLVK